MADALRELDALDRTVYQAVAVTPTPHLDEVFRLLSAVANRSRLWLGMAAAIAILGGRRGRLVAFESVLSIATTSAAVNLGIKPLVHRRRPQRVRSAWQRARSVPTPRSTSFPSGHSASAFAFAYAVGRHYPVLAVPIGLLATAVAYSRVHTGVHYPSDVVLGSIIGAGTAAVVTAACERRSSKPRRPPHGRLP
jgi:undecaprenyl-diphosphatase